MARNVERHAPRSPGSWTVHEPHVVTCLGRADTIQLQHVRAASSQSVTCVKRWRALDFRVTVRYLDFAPVS